MNENPIFQKIQQDITENPIVLYMKGTASLPLCGFSSTVVHILKALHVPFKDVNVLVDPELRQGIKDFTQWATIPQLYIKGEFVGGSDIVRELYNSGELLNLLKKHKILS
jgi:monothiol glutaredoxin